MLPRLTRSLLKAHSFPDDLSVPNYDARDLPAKVLQIGEGVFMRAFVDSLIHKLNQRHLFHGSVVVAQPRAGGHARKLNEQDGLFTVVLRGQRNGKLVQEREIVGCVREGIDPYAQHDKWLERAHDRALRFAFSNTTEAGIAISDADRLEDAPATSFPAKLTQLLWARYKHFHAELSTGLIFIPCELIERNGDTLKKLILETATKWKLEPAFAEWVNASCVFANTLVDRIVTGFPTAEADALQQSLGYADAHLDTAEPYLAWIIEAPAFVREELPLSSLGLNVTWADDVTPYRERKVRLLNGAHTLITPAALLAGLATVKQATDDPDLSAFLRKGLFDEILPTINQDRAELEQFARDVLERFANPFIAHQLSSIALNSVSKFKARLLPALTESTQANGRPPQCLTLALAALIELYRTNDKVNDDPAAIASLRGGASPDAVWPMSKEISQAVQAQQAHIRDHGIRASITTTLQ